jgi:hypothetical protein
MLGLGRIASPFRIILLLGAMMVTGPVHIQCFIFAREDPAKGISLFESSQLSQPVYSLVTSAQIALKTAGLWAFSARG